ncbi:MAG: glycosyltransferase [Vicinamibacterales bacterium]
MRVVALLTVRNEGPVLARCLRHLADEGVETCLVDHGSDDDTRRIAEAFRGDGVFRIEEQAYTGIFSLGDQLRKKEQLAAEIDADWFLHLDADEIRQAPWPQVTLRDAIASVDCQGWNAIDFDEFVFVPTADDDAFEGRDYVAGMRWYYYFEPASPDRHRINAWKKQTGPVDLHTHAGHQVIFPGRKVCPQSFIMRHYIVLGRAHALAKYGARRFAPDERERQWHSDRVRFDAAAVQWPSTSRLKSIGAGAAFDRSDPWTRHFWEQPHEQPGLAALRAFNEAQDGRVPPIAPLAAGTPRPFWSVMIPTFNPTPAYLRETLAGLLANDAGPAAMQIEVVDDGSVEVDVAAIVEEAGRGRVAFSAHATTVGMVRNWNTCVERARGEWVHILHQDDVVLPGFYEALRRPCESMPGLAAAFCRGTGIDEHGAVRWVQQPDREHPGVLVDFIARLAVEQRILTPAIVIRRRAYEEIGGYHLELPYCADWDFYKRLAVYGPIWYEPASLAQWRQHGSSTSARISAAGADLADRRRSIELSQAYLPADARTTVTAAALRGALMWAADILRDSLVRDDLATALTQAREIARTLEQATDAPGGPGATPAASAVEVARLRSQVDDLEAQVHAWMLAARKLTHGVCS